MFSLTSPVIRHALRAGVLGLLLLILAWPASSCGGGQGGITVGGLDLSRAATGEDANGAEATMKKYLEAVEKQDAEAQAALWVSSQKTAARRESEKYAKLDTSGIKMTDFHAQATDWPDHIIIHFNEVIPARGKLIAKAGLMQNVDQTWRIKELR